MRVALPPMLDHYRVWLSKRWAAEPPMRQVPHPSPLSNHLLGVSRGRLPRHLAEEVTHLLTLLLAATVSAELCRGVKERG